MDSSKNEQYYKMAIAWAEEYLKENKEPKPFNYKQGVAICNDLQFVAVNMERIKHSKGAELHASYARLREFKQFYEKIKEKGLLNKIV
jgi:hypothetical protein